MIDLSDIGIIIHFRKDIEDRLRNLKCVLSYYKKHSKNLEVVANSSGLPGVSLWPTTLIHSNSSKVLIILELTDIPLMFSISPLVTGCL